MKLTRKTTENCIYVNDKINEGINQSPLSDLMVSSVENKTITVNFAIAEPYGSVNIVCLDRL